MAVVGLVVLVLVLMLGVLVLGSVTELVLLVPSVHL